VSWGRVSSSDRLHRADQRTGSEHTLSCFLPCRSGIVAFGSASGATGSRTRTSQSAERVSLPAVGACAAPLSTGPVSRQVEPAISTLEAELSKTQRPRGGSQAQPARLERPMTSPEVERAALRAYAECEVDQRALESCVSWFSARRYAVSVTGPTGHGGARKKPDVACDTGLWSSEGAAKCHKRKGCPRSAFAQSSAMRPWHRGSAVKLDHNEIIGPLALFGGADAPDEQRARASRTLSIADRRPSPSESSHFFSFWHSPRSMRSPIAKKRQNPLPSKGFGTLRPRWAIMGRNHQWRGQNSNTHRKHRKKRGFRRGALQNAVQSAHESPPRREKPRRATTRPETRPWPWSWGRGPACPSRRGGRYSASSGWWPRASRSATATSPEKTDRRQRRASRRTRRRHTCSWEDEEWQTHV